ncbi:MAG: hypothetical protein HY538_03715 [Deltaproteobacteria bacterium]|nr:hypothetical protein [Deltaproteobacteria bacterium]
MRNFLKFAFTFLLVTSIAHSNYLYDVGATATTPNVLIIFDTSGSMTFDTSSITGRGRNSGCWTRGDEAGCATGGDGSANYPGLNPTGNRMFIAKQAISSVLTTNSTIRYGLMRYYQRESSRANLQGYWYRKPLYYSGDNQPRASDLNCNHDSQVLVGIGENTSTSILTWMDGVEAYPTNKELRGDGGTPIGRSLRSAKTYFEQTVIPNDTSASCRKNYVILVTDGLETCGGDPCREASNLRSVRIGSETYDIKTYVVGLAIPESLRGNLNCIAQNGGTQAPLFANNVTELQEALSEALNEIIEGDYSAASPIVTTIPFDPSLENRIADNALLTTGISLPAWSGSFKAYELFREYPPASEIFVRNDPPLLKWDAGALLATKPSSERQIFTWAGGARVDFTESNAATLNPYLGISDDRQFTKTKRFIRYLRGIDAYDEDNDGNATEERASKLGDIYHSSPAMVGTPPHSFEDTTYSDFKLQHINRTSVIYVGANDGMLHAFDALTGGELWGFVPPSLLNKLDDQISEHNFYVDLSPKVDDAKLNLSSSTTGWSTVLVVGQGWGGKAYTALDVTDPSNPRYLWEFSDLLRLGKTWSVPAIGRVYYNSTEQWVAVFGSGSEPLSLNGTIFVVDLKTGAELASFSLGATSVVADPVLVNLNPDVDLRIDIGYLGDTTGRLHELDFTSADRSQWRACRFYTAGSSKPIVSSPVLLEDEATSDLYVMIGTGLDTVENQGSQQEFAVLRNDDLATACDNSQRNCQINLTRGERVFSTGTINDGVLFFTTFLPTSGSGSSCSSNGNSFLRCMNYQDCSDVDCNTGEAIVIDPNLTSGLTSTGTSIIDLGPGKVTDLVVVDGQLYALKSTGELVHIGDATEEVNQAAPFIERQFFFAFE